MPGTRRDGDRCSCALAVSTRSGYAYNEEAFQYLLGVQRRRSQRSDRPFLLLLFDLRHPSGLPARIDAALARKLFAGLWRALREADVIGWYREEQIAGAVLTDLGTGPCADVSEVIMRRVQVTLSETLPQDIARRLQMRVCSLQPRLLSALS